MPRVTVVLIFRNGAEFLREAIESVRAQTESDWELISVDDASTDGSLDIAREYAALEPERIRVIQHPGGAWCGMSASRNLGIAQSSAPYVTFLDADDVFEAHKIADQADLLDRHASAAAVFGPNVRWFDWHRGSALRRANVVQDLGVPLDTLVHPPLMVERFLARPAATPLSVMARRTALEAAGGYEDEFRGMYEDQVMHAKLYLRLPAYVSSRTWCWYRQHPDSCVNQSIARGVRAAARLKYLKWLEEYLRTERLDYPSVERVLRRELWKSRHPRLMNADRRLRAIGRGVMKRLL